jgi:hypothetical protein
MSNPTIGPWPTHLRFSRRLGEAVPDAMYACALEGPRPARRLALLRSVLRSLRASLARACRRAWMIGA